MVKTTDLFQINGHPIPVPDRDVVLTRTDLDAADAGRDESGYLHRQVVRRRVRSWAFTYTFLSAEALACLQALLAGQDTFSFTFPQADGTAGTCLAYCADDTVTLRGAGDYRSLQLTVVEC